MELNAGWTFFYFVFSLLSGLELGFRSSLLFDGKVDTKLKSHLIQAPISFRLVLEMPIRLNPIPRRYLSSGPHQGAR